MPSPQPRLSLEAVSKDYPRPGPMRLRRMFSRLRGLHVEDGLSVGAISGLEADDDEEMADEEPVEDELPSGEAGLGRRVVDGVTLQAPGGCAIALTGPESAGKTVLLKLIGGIVAPTEGRVVIRGTVVPALTAMGLILPVRGDTVKSALPQLGAMVGLAPHSVRDSFDDIRALMGAPALLKSSTGLMETKRRRELILAMALSLEPDVLLLDIPIPDSAFGDRCLARLADLRAGGTLIVAEARDPAKLRLAVDRVVAMEEGRVVDAASRHGNPQAREPQDAAQPEPHQDPQDKEEDSVDPDHSPGEPEPDAANPEEDGVDPDHSPEEPDRDAADPEPAAAPVAPSKLDVDSLLQAIDRLTPAKRKSLLEALPLPPAPVVSDVESVLQAIDQLTPAKRKTLYEALPESPADARAPSKSDVEGALQAIAELSPPKQLAVYEALALPEVELGEGITVTARSRKEFRRLGRGIDATRLGWLGGLSAGDVLYDVGANCGSLTLAAAAMHGPDVRIVAVEPGYANFESLARNLSCNDMLGFVIPLQVALLDRSGLAPMRYHTATAAGRYRHAVGRHLDFLDDEFTPVATQTVPVFSLDSLLDLLGLPEPTHVKIGVDGTEERVLEGAVATLAGGAVSQLMIEIIDHDEAHSRLASVQRLLDGHGYELAETFWHHPEAERRYVADHLFTRR